MIGKPDELRAAATNSRSRSVRTHFVRDTSISIDALNYNKYNVSSQTSSLRSIQDHRHVLGHPARVPPHVLHHDHRTTGHRSSDMQLTSHHPPPSLVTLVQRGARRAPHPLWILTMTLRGRSPLETWQLQLAAQGCVHSHLCVVLIFYMVRSGLTRNHSPRKAHPSRPCPNRNLSICLCVPPIR